MEKTRIRELMRQRGYTQEMVAEALGITKQAVNLCISSGNPRMESLERIARLLNVPMYELFVRPEDLCTPSGPEVDIDCPHCGAHLKAVIPITITQQHNNKLTQ